MNMVVKKIYDILNNDHSDCLDFMNIISRNTRGKVSLIDDMGDVKEIDFDGKLVPKLYKNKLEGKKQIDTILPREKYLYLVEFKDVDPKNLLTNDIEPLLDKANDSLFIIKDKLLDSSARLSKKVKYIVFHGKRNARVKLSERIAKEKKDKSRSILITIGLFMFLDMDFINVKVFSYTIFKDWYYGLKMF